MGRRDFADQLADSGRAPLRGGAYAVDRVLDVRKAGKALQVLVRWRGQHEDSWQVLASCNAGTKREAWALAKRKFPPRADKRPEVSEVRPERSRVHLKRGGADPLLHLRKRLCGAGGRPLRAGRPHLSPVLPTYSPGLAGPFGAGAGRSVRGLPILWEPPGEEELRGRRWEESPSAVRAAAGSGTKRGSALADERLAKRRKEGRNLPGGM